MIFEKCVQPFHRFHWLTSVRLDQVSNTLQKTEKFFSSALVELNSNGHQFGHIDITACTGHFS